MSEQFDLAALEKALSVKERGKKEPAKARKSDKPIFVAVDKGGKEVEPKHIKEGKTYELKAKE